MCDIGYANSILRDISPQKVWKMSLQKENTDLFFYDANKSLDGAIHLQMMGYHCEMLNTMSSATIRKGIIYKFSPLSD